MQKLLFITTNKTKIMTAREIAADFDVTIVPKSLELVEIQAESGEKVASHKAEQAYEELQQPLIVTDDSWIIPGLNGFPGPYMRYVNEWFTMVDYERLTNALDDRRIILRQVIVYQDVRGQKVFVTDIDGLLLKKARGSNQYTHMALTSFDGGKHSAAELNATGLSAVGHRHTAWHDLFQWLKDKDNE